jgi:dTDP-4-amino-4,6-dideoxygalactose transaminase
MAGGYDGNDLAAAIGREQLKKLPEFTKRRNEIVKRYNRELKQSWKGNHLYPYFVKYERVKDFIRFMKDKGVSCGYHYPGNNWNGVSLPLYPSLTDEEVDYIIQKTKEAKCKF